MRNTSAFQRCACAALAVTLVVLAGCATPPVRRAPPVAEPVPVPVLAERPPMQYIAPEGEVDADTPVVPITSESPRTIQPGTGRFVDEQAARRPLPPVGPPGEVVFNFEGEPLQAVIKVILGDLLQQNYVIAPGVQGSVTFSTAKPIRADQALSVLEMLLSWNNAALVWGDGRYTVTAKDQALPGNLAPRMGGLETMRGYEVRAFPLRFISATEMEKLLKPYSRPNSVVSADNARSMLILAGTRQELQLYQQTIDVFDVDWLEGMSVGVFPLLQMEAAKMIGELEKIFGEGGNTPMAGMFRFMPLEGINAVMVITPQPRYLTLAEEWLQRLDAGSDTAAVRLYVYDVKNVKAVDLATTLNEIFGGGGGAATTRPRPPSGDPLMPGLEPVQIRPLGRSGQPESPLVRAERQAETRQERAAQRAAERQARAGGEGGAEGAGAEGAAGVAAVVDASGGIALGYAEDVRISAVEESNSLLIRATSGQWESIRRAIDRLDTIPLQVHIEAQILQVDLTDRLEFGVQWFFENAVPSELRSVANNRTGWSGFAGTIDAAAGLSWTFVGRDAAAFVDALDGVTKLEVLSAPSLVVLNNKSAAINVGLQIPVQSAIINTGGSTAIPSTSYVQFRDTGITLNVTPRVNPGGLVFMEIEQTDSTPVGAPGAGGNQSVNQRTISTEVAVQSGETVMLGGLIKNLNDITKGGLPGLSRIPVIGGLFGHQTRSAVRQELIVLIRPTVIRNSDEARRITDEYSRRFRSLEPLRAKLETPVAQ